MWNVPDMKERHRVILRKDGKMGNCLRARTDEEAKAFFWANVDKTDKCWLWRGSVTTDGYGRYMYQKKGYSTHRLSWWLHHGELPPSMDVLHTCDNRLCINPAHLYLGTDVENARDCIARGRANKPKGEQHPRAKLNTAKVIAIRASNLPDKPLAKSYGVAPSLIYAVRARRIWRHV